MTPEAIYAAITTGTMRNNAASLSDADKRLLAEFMGGRKLDAGDVGDAKNMPNRCAERPPVRDMNAPAWNGWSDLSNTRFQSAKDAGLTAGKVSRLKLKWALVFPVPPRCTGEPLWTAGCSSVATPAMCMRSRRKVGASSGPTGRPPWCGAGSRSVP